jgi:hypothetical protein
MHVGRRWCHPQHRRCLYVYVHLLEMKLRQQWQIRLTVFGAVYSAACDFVLALLPWKIVMGLQMKLHEKLGVALAMSVGIM